MIPDWLQDFMSITEVVLDILLTRFLIPKMPKFEKGP